MPHFMLRRSDAVSHDDSDSLLSDQPTVEAALADFGQTLNADLSLRGTAFEYILLQKDPDEANFINSNPLPVYVASRPA
jgi:hypothetical protein